MKKYAVLVGNSQFPDEKDKDQLPDLACPENDVDGLAQVLASENAEFEIIALKNKSAKEILKNFQFTVDKLQSDDLLLFYYSGHGIRSEKTEQLYLSTFDTEIAALEASAIYIDRIYNILNNNLRCTRKIILLDCCFSGAAAQGFKGVVDPWQQLNHNARGTYLVTSSTKSQVSKENAEEGYGLFTKYLISGLKTGEADKNNTGWINMDDWFDYVQSRVVAENPKQLPTMRLGNDGVQGGKLVIAKSGRDAKKEQLVEIKTYFSTLFAHHQIGQDTFIEMTQLLDKTRFSDFERQQYDLIVEVFETKKLAGFERKWDRLLLEVENEKEKLAEENAAIEKKLAEEQAVKEKVEQEILAPEKAEIDRKLAEEKAAKAEREKLANEMAAKQEAEKEKLVREKLAQKKAAKKKSEQEKITNKIECGWILALVLGILILSAMLFSMPIKTNFIDLIIVFLSAFGIYKKSRLAAMTMFIYFIYFIYSKLLIHIEKDDRIVNIVHPVIFLYFYFRAMIGTYQYHKNLKNS